jgi:hypothetical protein
MSTRRITVTAALLLALLPAGIFLLGGCESKPTEPVFDNPFDPDGPYLGDPLFVFATLNDTAAAVSWVQYQGFNIFEYEVFHSNSYGSGYERIEPGGIVPHTSTGPGLASYPYPDPTEEHYFKVLALTKEQDFIFASYQKPGSIITPPLVIMGDASGFSATRYLDLQVTVTHGDSLLIADNAEFLGGLRLPVAMFGSPHEIEWDLGPADSNGSSRHIFVKSLGAPTEATIFDGSVHINFQPAFTVVDEPATVATVAVDLAVPVEGVLQMRFSTSAEALATETWLDPAPVVSGFELVDTLNPQVIYGEFTGDFGFTSPIMEFPVKGDSLSDASFEVDLGTAPVSIDPVVTLACTATATLMRFSEGQDFTLAPWLEYSATPAFALSADPGIKTIYGQFRNDYTDSPVISASVEYMQQAVAVGFLNPVPDRNMDAGSTYEITGWAAALGTAVDSVKVEVGDGLGFVAVEGLEDWSFDWDVPEAEEAAPLMLRVRAWAAADSATAQVSVDIVP